MRAVSPRMNDTGITEAPYKLSVYRNDTACVNIDLIVSAETPVVLAHVPISFQAVCWQGLLMTENAFNGLHGRFEARPFRAVLHTVNEYPSVNIPQRSKPYPVAVADSDKKLRWILSDLTWMR